MQPKLVAIPGTRPSNDDTLTALPAQTEKPGSQTDYEDEVVAQARAHDIMHDELYEAWVNGGKVGPNPDNLQREALSTAYREMIDRQRQQQERAPKSR